MTYQIPSSRQNPRLLQLPARKSSVIHQLEELATVFEHNKAFRVAAAGKPAQNCCRATPVRF